MVKEPCRRYEFDMENANMKGHWTGIFTQKENGTEIDFTEDVTAKKLIMKPFVKGYLKKQQELYLSDLKKAMKLLLQFHGFNRFNLLILIRYK